MRKLVISSLLVTISILFVSQVSAADMNLVLNPGFEEVADDGTPEDWYPTTWGAPPKCELDSKVFHGGKYSARIDNSSVFWAQDNVSAEGGATYKLTFWAKSENLKSTGQPAGACFFYFNKGARQHMDLTALEGTVNWKKFTKILIPSEGATSMKIWIGQFRNTPESGSMWIDDVELKKLEE